jgi:Cleft lip and palate transmembrane protein 1 (CLPTM1)
MLVETNPWFLGLTALVSILHMMFVVFARFLSTFIVLIRRNSFEMLAFKNDVSHWKNKKELVGVSVRTVSLFKSLFLSLSAVPPKIVTNVVVQFIILLYLLDNNTDTSWMIIFGQGTGMVIEAWKVSRMRA